MRVKLFRTPKLLMASGAALVMAGAVTDKAEALSISADNGDGPIIVADNGIGDLDPNAGIIDYDSTIGPDVPGWHVSAQAEVCSIECPNVALSLEADSLGAPGTLTFLVTETDFELPVNTWLGFHALGPPTLLSRGPEFPQRFQLISDRHQRSANP